MSSQDILLTLGQIILFLGFLVLVTFFLRQKKAMKQKGKEQALYCLDRLSLNSKTCVYAVSAFGKKFLVIESAHNLSITTMTDIKSNDD